MRERDERLYRLQLALEIQVLGYLAIDQNDPG
jgi:hypothetical protein